MVCCLRVGKKCFYEDILGWQWLNEHGNIVGDVRGTGGWKLQQCTFADSQTSKSFHRCVRKQSSGCLKLKVLSASRPRKSWRCNRPSQSKSMPQTWNWHLELQQTWRHGLWNFLASHIHGIDQTYGFSLPKANILGRAVAVTSLIISNHCLRGVGKDYYLLSDQEAVMRSLQTMWHIPQVSAWELADCCFNHLEYLKDFAEKETKFWRAEAASARREAEGAATEVSRLEAGLREVRGKLEQRRSETSGQKAQGAIAQALTEAKSSGKIPGIYGRLGKILHKSGPRCMIPLICTCNSSSL